MNNNLADILNTLKNVYGIDIKSVVDTAILAVDGALENAYENGYEDSDHAKGLSSSLNTLLDIASKLDNGVG